MNYILILVATVVAGVFGWRMAQKYGTSLVKGIGGTELITQVVVGCFDWFVGLTSDLMNFVLNPLGYLMNPFVMASVFLICAGLFAAISIGLGIIRDVRD